MAVTYAGTIQKLNAAKKRIEKLVAQLHDESLNHDSLVAQLNTVIGNHIGHDVQLVPVNKPSKLEEVVQRRITQLRGQRKSYDEIAMSLNVEGFRPEPGKNFNGIMVKMLAEG